jgi:hypothetical protein
MKITIENTSKIVTLNGVPARIWEGKTESGIPVHCFVTRIAVASHQCTGEIEKQFCEELEQTVTPSEQVLTIPLALIL